jgi:hypothetical protein
MSSSPLTSARLSLISLPTAVTSPIFAYKSLFHRLEARHVEHPFGADRPPDFAVITTQIVPHFSNFNI